MGQILLDGIVKSYGKEVVVKNLDLLVEPGEFLTILGPSGCGKTTTLRMIAGLEEPNQGNIKLDDKVVFSRNEGVVIPPEARNLGLIFQSYALWPHMTVEKNITLALKEQKISKDEIASRLANALNMVQLTGYAERYPSELSGGQQQRVAVARLIALRPTILLMDEPLSNLDAKLRTEMRASLKRLHRDLDATTVYVTHDQIEALTLSDRVIIMNEGQIMQEGSPYDIYHHPTNIFVAEFIGDPGINLFEGNIENGKLNCGGISIPLPSNISNNNGRLTVGVRPEKIEVSESKKSGWQEVTTGIIQPTGANTIMEVKSEDTSITVLQNGFINLSENSKLWINFDSETLSFFDPKTQENLRNKMV
jgi:ABC-type sugar transport system ATPase subunit|tara:strand:- start:2653 stop:3744 length:1092 start_codon:yes stop_codon:yes gene_type:complete